VVALKTTLDITTVAEIYGVRALAVPAGEPRSCKTNADTLLATLAQRRCSCTSNRDDRGRAVWPWRAGKSEATQHAPYDRKQP